MSIPAYLKPYLPDVDDLLVLLGDQRHTPETTLRDLLLRARSGEPNAIEALLPWLTNLNEGHDALRRLLLNGIMDGGAYVQVAVAADALGVAPSTIYRRLSELGIATIEGPRTGPGPKTGTYFHRAELARLGVPAAGPYVSDPARRIPAARIRTQLR